VAKANVVACPSAKLDKAFPASTPAAQAYGGYGQNYVYLGYLVEADRVKVTAVTKPTETCMNGDGLDPTPGLNWWNFGYLYPPSLPPWGAAKVGVRSSITRQECVSTNDLALLSGLFGRLTC
jgi:hypothetical protein